MTELAELRLCIAELKAAPIYNKSAHAEKTIDAAVSCIAGLDRRLSQLEERAGNDNRTT